LALFGLVVLLAAGCASKPLPSPSDEDAAPFAGTGIQVGDQVKVTFPGAPNLNLAQEIRVDGLLNLGQPGDVKVVGKTPKEIEAELLKIYGPDLVIKEVTVTVASAPFPVFVSGAVLRPGKVLVNRSVTVLEAIMEAGGFDPNRADLKKVQVVRQENGIQKTFVINVKDTLNYAETSPFHLRPSDIVVVPERFVFF
jgi:polysaccharide export outer membrane protein